MPYALIIIGAVLVVAGVRDTQGDLWTLVKGDFTGSDNFVYWMVAMLAIGSLGYIKEIRPAANALLALVIIVLFLSNKGFFTQFLQQIQSTNSGANNSIASDLSSITSSSGFGRVSTPGIGAI